MSQPLSQWCDRAGVRVQPRRVPREDRERGLQPFPEHLVPYFDHEALAGVAAASGRHALRLCESIGAFDRPGARDEPAVFGLAEPEPVG
jgi:hypothetical protein